MDRATCKIEIPFTDHAHCIGRQGNQIQSIMLATDTHIHFPDSNREPNGTKSNQVSITGTIASIEQARKRVRDILPMSLKFHIPPRESIHTTNDDYPLFQYVRARYGVMVLPRPYTKTGEIYCIVRGLINQPELPEATEYLLQAFYGFESSSIKVTCQTEVSEQYHGYLQTRQQSKDMCIAAIEQYTHATIQFPTATINKNGYGRKTSVLISGTPTQVCQARKLFDLCLPIILTFEIPTDREPTRVDIIYIKDKLNVTTVVRTRKDKLGKLVTVQTQEYNSDQLFRARSFILDLPSADKTNLPKPKVNNRSFDMDSSSTLLSDLSLVTPTRSSSSDMMIPKVRLTDNLYITSGTYFEPSTKKTDNLLVTSNKTTVTKKPSPIGHERSSLRNFDKSTIFGPTNNNQFSSAFIFDTPKHQFKSITHCILSSIY